MPLCGEIASGGGHVPSGFLGKLLDRVRGPNYDAFTDDVEDANGDVRNTSSNSGLPPSSEVQEEDREAGEVSTFRMDVILPQRQEIRAVESANRQEVSEDAPVTALPPPKLRSRRRMLNRSRTPVSESRPMPAVPQPSIHPSLEPPPLPSLGTPMPVVPRAPLPQPPSVPQSQMLSSEAPKREPQPEPPPLVLQPRLAPTEAHALGRQPEPQPTKRQPAPVVQSEELELELDFETPVSSGVSDDELLLDDDMFERTRRWRSPISFGGNVLPTLMMAAGIAFLVLSQSAFWMGGFNVFSKWMQSDQSAPVVRNCVEVAAQPSNVAAQTSSPVVMNEQAPVLSSVPGPVGVGTPLSVTSRPQPSASSHQPASMAVQNRHPGRSSR